MIEIEYNGSNNNLKAAVEYVNQIFGYEYFLNTIYKQKYFYMSDLTPKAIVDIIHDTDLFLSIELYCSLYLKDNALVYDDPEDARIIHLNKWTLNRPVHSLSNTLMHQCVHALNAAHPAHYFGHGDNNPVGKETTAPYWIAGLAQKIIAEDDKVYDTVTHEQVKNIPRLQQCSKNDIQQTMYDAGVLCCYDYLQIMGAE